MSAPDAVQEERYLQELIEHYIEIDALDERVDSPRTWMPTTGAIEIIRAAERDHGALE